ncbi:MAG: GntR family transcriptional regulator [Planctomycetota bacterium]
MSEREGIPIYQRIRMQLYREISSGCLKIGELIPSETSLMKQYSASRTTVRKAIESLSKKGFIVRKRGVGSFVEKDIVKANIRLRGSFKDILAVAQNTSTKVVGFEYVDPTPEILKNLKQEDEAQVLRIDRVRCMENTPFLYSINYLPDAIGQLLMKKDLEQFALIELIPKKCNLPVVKAIQNFGATIADSVMAKMLDIPLGFPVLQIERVTMTSEDRPVNLFYGFFRSDVYKFTTAFSF